MGITGTKHTEDKMSFIALKKKYYDWDAPEDTWSWHQCILWDILENSWMTLESTPDNQFFLKNVDNDLRDEFVTFISQHFPEDMSLLVNMSANPAMIGAASSTTETVAIPPNTWPEPPMPPTPPASPSPWAQQAQMTIGQILSQDENMTWFEETPHPINQPAKLRRKRKPNNNPLYLKVRAHYDKLCEVQDSGSQTYLRGFADTIQTIKNKPTVDAIELEYMRGQLAAIKMILDSFEEPELPLEDKKVEVQEENMQDL